MLRAILLAAMLVLFPGTSGGVQLPLTGEQLEQFVEYPFSFVIGVTKEEVVRWLGPPKKHERKVKRNPHVEKIRDVFQAFHYDGLELEIAAFPGANPPTVDLIRVLITDRQYKLKYGLGVGSSKNRVQRVLGRSETDFEMATWDYEAHEGFLWLRFTFQNDRVARIDWVHEWD